MSLLNLVTRGHLDDSTPLSVATRGHLNLAVADEAVKIVVVEPPKRQGSPGGIGPKVGYIPPYTQEIEDRKLKDHSVHADDEEVLRILIEAITSGVLK